MVRERARRVGSRTSRQSVAASTFCEVDVTVVLGQPSITLRFAGNEPVVGEKQECEAVRMLTTGRFPSFVSGTV